MKYYECKYEHSDCKGNHEDDCAKRMLLLYEIEKLKEENVELRFETVRAFERGQKFPCNLNCDECTKKCRAWQNGYNATCERECDNCEVLADMQNLKNVLSKLLFDYADVLRGDTE